MSTTLTTREARVLRSARECAEMSDVARARRTEPTPLQQHQARMHWFDKRPLLVRKLGLFG